MSYLQLKSYGAGSSCPELAKGVLRLYSMRFCPYAQRTRLVLEHKKIPYETVNVQLYNRPDWLLEKNPFGLLPAVEKDGQIIYESIATCEWLDAMYPEYPPKLMPGDPYVKAKDRALLENFGALARRFRTRILFHKDDEPDERGKPFDLPELFEEITTDPDRVERKGALPDLIENLKFYEKALKDRGGPFFGGTDPSMLDFYLWPEMERVPVVITALEAEPATVLGDKKKFSKLSAWIEAMTQLPAVKATMFDVPTHLHFLKTLLEGKPDYDCNL